MSREPRELRNAHVRDPPNSLPLGQRTMSSAADAPAPQIEDAPSSGSSNLRDARLTPDSESDSDLEVYGDGDRLGDSVELKKTRRDLEKAESGSTTPGRHDVGYHVDNDDETDIRLTRRSATFSKTFTHEEERAVVKKFDRRLVLFMALLYMLSFLDRSSKPGSLWGHHPRFRRTC